jgi:hypothetical protein
MRSDAQEEILAYLRQDRPVEMAYADSTPVSLPPTKPKLMVAPIKPKPSLAPIKPELQSLAPIKPEPQSLAVADDTSFDARFAAVWAGASNVLGPPVIRWTEHSYAGVLN